MWTEFWKLSRLIPKKKVKILMRIDFERKKLLEEVFFWVSIGQVLFFKSFQNGRLVAMHEP
jgi:hypothetical protein